MNSISKLERCSNVIHNTCSYAASQLASIGKNFFNSFKILLRFRCGWIFIFTNERDVA